MIQQWLSRGHQSDSCVLFLSKSTLLYNYNIQCRITLDHAALHGVSLWNVVYLKALGCFTEVRSEVIVVFVVEQNDLQ